VAVLNYTYRAYPTPEQERWLNESTDQCRRWWNDLVGRQKQAHRQMKATGRPDATRAKLGTALAGKKMTGMRAAKL
jgi:transposase